MDLKSLPALGLLAIVVLDLVLRNNWVRIYFVNGIRLFSYVSKVVTEKDFSKFKLSRIIDEKYFLDIENHSFDKNTFAIREEVSFISIQGIKKVFYTPIITGLIKYSKEKNELVLYGILNPIASFFSILLLFGIIILPIYVCILSGFTIWAIIVPFFIILMIFGFCGIIIRIQKNRYIQIFNDYIV
jgi:hypothetical protein